MSKYNDLTFLQNIKEFIKENCSEIKEVELFQFPERPAFPMVVISMNEELEREQDIDSSRDINYLNVILDINIFTKSTNTQKNKYLSCMILKNTIIDLLKNNKDYKNIILQLDRQLPNLNSEVCRWKLTFSLLVDTKKNIIL